MPKRTQRTEEGQWRVLQTHMHSRTKHVGKEELKRFTRNATNKTGWTKARLETWLARLVNQKKLATLTLDPPHLREHAIAVTEGTTAQRTQARMERGVAKWVRNNTKGKVTATHLARMKASLRVDGGSRKGVEAAVLMAEARGELSLEDRVKAQKGLPRPAWRQEAMKWAEEAGWNLPTHPTLETAPQKTPMPAATTVIELGSGWEGATEGLKAMFDRVVTVDKNINTITHHKAWAVPELRTTFEKLGQNKQGAVLKAAETAGVTMQELAGVWASPHCTLWSTGQEMSMDSDREAEREAEREGERNGGLGAVLRGIDLAVQKKPSIQWVLENTATSALQHLPEIAKLGAPTVVQACAYGERKSGKRYRLWMSAATKRQFTPILPTDPKSRCEQCKAGKDHTQAQIPSEKQRLGKTRERVNIPGKTTAAANNRVPPDLARHLAWAMRQAYNIEKKAARKEPTRTRESRIG